MGQFLSFFAFMTLIVLEVIDQIFYRMLLHLGLSDISFLIRLSFNIWGKKTAGRSEVVFFAVYRIRVMPVGLLLVMGTLITWLRAGFSTVELLLSTL